MQKIIIEKPYKFVPPYQGVFWSWLIMKLRLHGNWLRKEGVTDFEVRHADRLRRSLDEGHGILVAPNHCRTADPLVMGWVAQAANCHFNAMASWHLFHQDWLTSWAIRMMGAFSVNREGVDREAINMAIDILQNAKRPLIIFPEGAVSRTNDRLHALLDGVAFIARTAAKRRARMDPPGKVVVHPLAIKYLFQGDLAKQVDLTLTDIEERFSWRPQKHLPLTERIAKTGLALLTLKELEYFNEPQSGTLGERLERLINGLLHPLEREWLGKESQGPVVPRVKAVRMKILPDMVKGNLSEEDREHRWSHLADLYLAQQISCYPADYLESRPSKDRYLETIERFEEDLTDKVRTHGSLRVIMHIDQPIEVSPERVRGVDQDPLMAQLAQRLQFLLDELAKESELVV